MKKLVAIMALSFGLIISSYAQEKAPQMRERKMNDSCKMMSTQDNHKMNGERKNFDSKSFYARPQQMRHGMRNFDVQGEHKYGKNIDGKGKMDGRPMMNREEGRPMEHQMYMRGRGVRGNMYHNFPPKPEQKVEIEKKDVKENVKEEVITPKIRKGPSVDESTLSMEDFLMYINYKE